MQAKKKVSIVLEETEGTGFRIYVDGDKEILERISKRVSDMAPVEIWGDKLFNLCVATLARFTKIGGIYPKQDQPPAENLIVKG